MRVKNKRVLCGRRFIFIFSMHGQEQSNILELGQGRMRMREIVRRPEERVQIRKTRSLKGMGDEKILLERIWRAPPGSAPGN